MDIEKPQSLKIIKTEDLSLMMSRHYATDVSGNVWVTLENNGVRQEWRLYKKAAEVAAAQAPLSFQQIIDAANE